jgi:hypothetical protein
MNSLRSGRPFAVTAALWMLGATFMAPSIQADERSVRKELEALYARFAQAVKQNERYTMKRLFLDYSTTDFRMRLENGKTLSREDAAEAMEDEAMAAARFIGQEIRILKLTLKGSAAIAVYKDRTTAVVDDPQGNTHKIVALSTTRDTWVKTPEGWKARLTEVLSSKTLLDGKEVKIKPRRTRSRSR